MTDLGQCSESVFGIWSSHRCHNKATVVRDGKPYCKVHDPEYIKEKQAKKNAIWEEKWAREAREIALRRARMEATVGLTLEELGKLTPALVRAASSMYEALQALVDYLAYLGVPEDGEEKYHQAEQALAKAEGREEE